MKRYVYLIVMSVVIMFGLMATVQYFMYKEDAERRLLAKAERDLEESKRVDAVQAEVESAVRNMMSTVSYNLDNPDRYYVISTQMVHNNPHIVGAGMAFKPNYYLSKGKDELYAPYAYDEAPEVKMKKKMSDKKYIRTRLLGFDYTEREWYKKSMETGKGFWTEPYLDQGGTHIIMCTYVETIRDASGRTVGVFFADVPMEDVSLLSMNLNEDISENGWTLLLIQVLFLVIFCFIVWLAVRASQHYKSQKVDVEKDTLLAEVERLKEVNKKLTERNMELNKMLNKKLLSPN